MKICVLVKEVPDAAVEKRIDSSTGRMDRSGEKNLNPYDTHAIEAAMQIKEGGAVPVEEIVAVTMGPDSAVRALHKAVSLGADRSVHLSDQVVAGFITEYGKSIFSPDRIVHTEPSIRATVAATSCRLVEPYRKLRDPLALVAIVPPMEADHSVGSGA